MADKKKLSKTLWSTLLIMSVIMAMLFTGPYAYAALDTGNIQADASAGSFSISDALTILKVITGDSPSEITFFDVDGDEKPGMAEVIYILQVLAGTRDEITAPSIVMLAATGTDTLTLAWIPSVVKSENTSAELSYEVHASTEENFTPGQDTLKTTVSGENQAEITGLDAGTLYHVTVLARDASGNRSIKRDYRSVTTFESGIRLSEENPPVSTEELNLGIPVINGAIYTFAKTGEATLPEPGNILFGEDESGNVFMRKVYTAYDWGEDLVVKTQDASLSEAIEQGVINTSIKLFDVAQAADSENSARSNVTLSRSKKQDGTRYTRMEWKDSLLTAEQTDYVYDEDRAEVIPGEDIGEYNIRMRESRETSQEVEFKAVPKFEPELTTDVRWSDTTIHKAEVIAKGKLSFDVLARYRFEAANTYENEFNLFKKSWVSVYAIGVVPVEQKITLTVKAEVTAGAELAVDAATNAHASAFVQVGVRYNTETLTWEQVTDYPNPDYGVDTSLTTDLNVQGSVNAQIRLVPELEVKFYEVAAAGISVEPYLRGQIAAEALANADLLTGHYTYLMQPTAFDVALGLECFVGAYLDVLVKEIPLFSKTRIIGPPPNTDGSMSLPEYYLFSLPEIELDGGTYDTVNAGQEIELKAVIKDGANNAFDAGSLKWEIFPEPAQGKIELTPGAPLKVKDGEYLAEATMTACTEGTYTVFVSGHGILGEIGRRFAMQTFTFSGGMDSCKPNPDFSISPRSGVNPLKVTLDASDAKSPAGIPISKYEWTGSTGQSASGVNASMTFSGVGVHHVTLKVTDEEGYSSQKTLSVPVGDSVEYRLDDDGGNSIDCNIDFYNYFSDEYCFSRDFFETFLDDNGEVISRTIWSSSKTGGRGGIPYLQYIYNPSCSCPDGQRGYIIKKKWPDSPEFDEYSECYCMTFDDKSFYRYQNGISFSYDHKGNNYEWVKSDKDMNTLECIACNAEYNRLVDCGSSWYNGEPCRLYGDYSPYVPFCPPCPPWPKYPANQFGAPPILDLKKFACVPYGYLSFDQGYACGPYVKNCPRSEAGKVSGKIEGLVPNIAASYSVFIVPFGESSLNVPYYPYYDEWKYAYSIQESDMSFSTVRDEGYKLPSGLYYIHIALNWAVYSDARHRTAYYAGPGQVTYDASKAKKVELKSAGMDLGTLTLEPVMYNLSGRIVGDGHTRYRVEIAPTLPFEYGVSFTEAPCEFLEDEIAATIELVGGGNFSAELPEGMYYIRVVADFAGGEEIFYPYNNVGYIFYGNGREECGTPIHLYYYMNDDGDTGDINLGNLTIPADPGK